MLKLILTAIFVLPSLAFAANPEITVIKREENSAKGIQRLCVTVGTEATPHCSEPVKIGDAKVAEIMKLHLAAGKRLKFKSINWTKYTIDSLHAAILAAQAPAPAPVAVDVPVVATPEECTVTGATLVQEMRKDTAGKAFIWRGLVLTGLHLPGSTKTNKSVSLVYEGDLNSKANYRMKGNYALDSTKEIEIKAQAPSSQYEGAFVPESLTVNITKDSGEAVSSKTCKVTIPKAPVSNIIIPALETGIK